jgi:hypothetical protein
MIQGYRLFLALAKSDDLLWYLLNSAYAEFLLFKGKIYFTLVIRMIHFMVNYIEIY